MLIPNPQALPPLPTYLFLVNHKSDRYGVCFLFVGVFISTIFYISFWIGRYFTRWAVFCIIWVMAVPGEYYLFIHVPVS